MRRAGWWGFKRKRGGWYHRLVSCLVGRCGVARVWKTGHRALVLETGPYVGIYILLS